MQKWVGSEIEKMKTYFTLLLFLLMAEYLIIKSYPQEWDNEKNFKVCKPLLCKNVYIV